MKNTFSSIAVFFFVVFLAQSQTVFGKWKANEDETGKSKSIVGICEKSGDTLE